MATESILRPGEIKDILLREIEAADLATSRRRGSRHRPRGERRHRPHLRPPDGDGGEMLEFTAPETGETVTGLVLNLEEDNVGAVDPGRLPPAQGRRRGPPHRPRARGAGRPGDARPRGRRARPPGRRPRRRSRRSTTRQVEIGGAGHHRAAAGEGAAADRHQGHRRDDPDRPRPARADHRRPRHRQDRHRGRHDHQPEGHRRHLRVRRHRPEGVDGRHGGRAAQARPARWSTPSSSSPPPPTRRRCSTSRRTPAARWPSTSCTRRGRPTLCVYDDLSKQAAAYRQLSLDAAPPAGPRGVPGRRVLPPLAACSSAPRSSARTPSVVDGDARSRSRAARSPRCRSSRRRPATCRPTSRPTSSRSPTGRSSSTTDLFYSGRASGGERRHLACQPRGRQRADQGDEAGGRPAPLSTWRSTASSRPSPQFGSDLDAATQRQLARGARTGRSAQAAAVPADAGRAAGRDHLRRDQRLPRRRGGRAHPAVGARLPRLPRGVSTPDVLDGIRTKKALDDDLTAELKARASRPSSRCSAAD